MSMKTKTDKILIRIIVFDIILAILLGFVWVNHTFADTAQAIMATEIRCTNATYTTARDSIAGDATATSDLQIGQTTGFAVHRVFMAFEIPELSYDVLSCSLYVSGNVDGSTTDFNVNIYGASGAKSTIDAEDFDQFDGHEASGTYSGTVLNETWSSSSYVDEDWNKIVFNGTGRDSVEAASGDTLWVALISSRDVSSTQPSGNEYVNFDGILDAGLEPYLSYTVAIPDTTYKRSKIIYANTPQVLYKNTVIPLYKP